jgi:hypothetical protein
VCNFTRCPPSNVFIEDTPDDFGLSFDNSSLTLFAGNRSIPIGPSTCIEALAYTTGQTPAHLVGVVLAVELAHESAKPNQDRIDDAFVNGSYFDTKERKPLVNTGEVFHIAREAIESLDNYDIE